MKIKSFFAFALFACSLFFTACNDDDTITICEESPQTDCLCIEIYEPVCGCNEVTYGNSCEAECAGITTYTQGTCR